MIRDSEMEKAMQAAGMRIEKREKSASAFTTPCSCTHRTSSKQKPHAFSGNKL